jgi:hypothetical protein
VPRLLTDDQKENRYLPHHQISVVLYPPYSLTVTPADLFLFPKLKTTLEGRRFQTIEGIQENARHHRKCFSGSILTIEERLGTVYRQ